METAGGQAVLGEQHAAGCTLLAPRVVPAPPGGQPTTPMLGAWSFLACGMLLLGFHIPGERQGVGEGKPKVRLLQAASVRT